ncbi:MAG: tetratricopeptide repeat protein [Clostridium butyricum]|nr:tetratricopeptide repeat protein [Clostridium butyricum]
MQLDDNLYKQILDICNDGKFCVKRGRNNEAIEHYKKALELVSEPKGEWMATFWLYESIGDAYFYDFLYKECLEWMMKAFALPDGDKDPFVLLRIGECHYEMGNFEQAKKFLLETRKYDVKNLMEMDDSKYFNLIKGLII